MKNIFGLLIMLFLFPLCGFCQLEWDEKRYNAVDYARGFSWNLPHDSYHTWNKQEGKEAHTIFRVFQTQTGVVAFLNFHPFEKAPIYDSILDVYDEMVQNMSTIDMKMKAKGVHVDRQNLVYNFNGEPAICSYYIQRFKNSKTGKEDVTHCLSFYLMGKLGTYIVAVKCNDVCFFKHGIAYLSGVASGFFLIKE